MIDDKYVINDQIWYWTPQGLLAALPYLDQNPIREKIDEYTDAVFDDDFLRENASLTLAASS